MRIISGSLKGRNIDTYNIEGTRPTMDRVKESFIASIQLKLKNSAKEDSFFYIVQYLTNISWICHFFIRFSRFLKKKRHQEQQLNHLDPCRAVSSFSSFRT